MQRIRISDMTMKQTGEEFCLSFKDKIELSKLLDKLGVAVIELEGIENPKVDSLRIKSIAAAVTEGIVAVPVQLSGDGAQQVWNALQLAKHPRLQVCAPVSPVQMEYLFHKKPEVMLEIIRSTVEACKKLCGDVEFVAVDATRADPEYLRTAIKLAIEAGATTVTVCDTAGTMLPTELVDLIRRLRYDIETLADVELGISCDNSLAMADACAVAAACELVDEIKTAAYPIMAPSLSNVAKVIAVKGKSRGVDSNVQVTQLGSVMEQIGWLCQSGKGKMTAAVQAEVSDIYLTAHDDAEAVAKVVADLGYDLSEEDLNKVYEAFKVIAEKKEQVSTRELDAIVASAAMQVPPVYKLDSYLITSGNTISATAHIKLTRNGELLEGVYIGDGSIDAAFQAIEHITGVHYELDDFQLQAVTKGREAMGRTVVKLRSAGKVYSGEGLSTDIVGAGIQAYLSALNKIVYEEEQV